jgi:hypothetical protein
MGKKAKKKAAPEAEGYKRIVHSLQVELVKLQWPTRDALTLRSRDPAAAPIFLSVEGIAHELVSGNTRGFPSACRHASLPAHSLRGIGR